MKQFSELNTSGIRNGQRLTAAQFRQLAAESPSNPKPPARKRRNPTQKKSKRSNSLKSSVELPWHTMFLEEVLRLEADQVLINKDREYYYQVKVMLYVAQNFPELKKVVHASPNGASRKNAFEAMRLNYAGLCKGHPDLQFMIMRGNYGGLFIEMKKRIEDYSSEQNALKEVHIEQHHCRIELNKRGYLSIVCFGYEEAVEAFQSYMNNVSANNSAFFSLGI
jgi:hypothetical protein